MTKNDVMSLLESNSPLDYPILTPLVSFVSLRASFQAGLIYSLETLTLPDIDHVSIMKPHTGKRWDHRQSGPKHASVQGNLTPQDPYIGSIGSKTSIYKENHTWHAG